MTMPPLKNLIGQDAAQRQFWDSYQSGRLAQSWIFLGPKGVGKSTFVQGVARTLLADTIDASHSDVPTDSGGSLFAMDPTPAPPKMELNVHDPEHPVYRKIEAGTHPDLLLIDCNTANDSDKKKKDVTVDAIRKVSEFLRGTAQTGKWRIVVIDDAETMNKNASNALLKILEEPPKGALIILIASTIGFFPPTIRSRCRVLTFQPLSAQNMEFFMDRDYAYIEGAERDILIDLAGGSPGQLKSLIDEEGLKLYTELEKFLNQSADRQLAWPQLHQMADKLDQKAALAFDLYCRILQKTIRAGATRKGPVSPVSARLLAFRPVDFWLDHLREAEQLVGKQQFLYLDTKQTWLGLFSRLAA